MTMKMPMPVLVPVALTRKARHNPNVMSEEKSDALGEVMDEFGFLQPVVLQHMDDDGFYEIVDGEHRIEQLKKRGIEKVTAFVDDWTPSMVTQLRIAMNHLRGNLDLGMVARDLQQLIDSGIPSNELARMTGFTDKEVSKLVASLNRDEEIDIPDIDDDEPAPAPKPFLMEVLFATRADLKRASKALKKAGNGDITAGLLRFVDGK